MQLSEARVTEELRLLRAKLDGLAAQADALLVDARAARAAIYRLLANLSPDRPAAPPLPVPQPANGTAP